MKNLRQISFEKVFGGKTLAEALSICESLGDTFCFESREETEKLLTLTIGEQNAKTVMLQRWDLGNEDMGKLCQDIANGYCWKMHATGDDIVYVYGPSPLEDTRYIRIGDSDASWTFLSRSDLDMPPTISEEEIITKILEDTHSETLEEAKAHVTSVMVKNYLFQEDEYEIIFEEEVTEDSNLVNMFSDALRFAYQHHMSKNANPIIYSFVHFKDVADDDDDNVPNIAVLGVDSRTIAAQNVEWRYDQFALIDGRQPRENRLDLVSEQDKKLFDEGYSRGMCFELVLDKRNHTVQHGNRYETPDDERFVLFQVTGLLPNETNSFCLIQYEHLEWSTEADEMVLDEFQKEANVIVFRGSKFEASNLDHVISILSDKSLIPSSSRDDVHFTSDGMKVEIGVTSDLTNALQKLFSNGGPSWRWTIELTDYFGDDEPIRNEYKYELTLAQYASVKLREPLPNFDAGPGFTCPEKVTEEDIARDEPSYQRSYQNHGQFKQIRVFETNDFLLRYDYGDAVWAMCVKDLFTIDFDIKEGVSQRDAVLMVKRYTDFMHSKGVDLLFSIYETDRGLHAYLISERLLYGDARTLQTSLGLCNDKNYIIFTGFNGFCMRVAPKLKKQKKDPVTGEPILGKTWMTEDEIGKEFIARLCYQLAEPGAGLDAGLTCTIGYGRADPYLEMMLDVYEKLIDFFKYQYAIKLARFTSTKSFEWGGIKYDKINAPPPEFLQEAKDFVQNLLSSYGIVAKGEYQIPMKWRGFMTEYKPFLDANTLYQCANVSPYEINRRARTVVLDAWKQNCPKQAISICGFDDPAVEAPGQTPSRIFGPNPNGMGYPFVFGVDKSSHMVFIQFRDLLMLDWDVKDGFPKIVPAQMLNRYLVAMKTYPRAERITPTPMAFKMYETDNGVHAYCVSHFMPYDMESGSLLSPPLEVMHNTCVDAWYIAFVKTRGYSIRVGPKVINRARGLGQSDTMKPPEEVRSQFVQKEGVVVPGRKEDDRTVYLGEGQIVPYLDKVTDFILEIQKYVVQIPDLARRIIEEPEALSIEMGEVVKEIYDRDVRPYENPDEDPDVAARFMENYLWADQVWRCPKFPLE